MKVMMMGIAVGTMALISACAANPGQAPLVPGFDSSEYTTHEDNEGILTKSCGQITTHEGVTMSIRALAVKPLKPDVDCGELLSVYEQFTSSDADLMSGKGAYGRWSCAAFEVLASNFTRASIQSGLIECYRDSMGSGVFAQNA